MLGRRLGRRDLGGLAAAAGLGASVVIAFGGFGLPETVAVPIGAFVMTMLASGILFLFAYSDRKSVV